MRYKPYYVVCQQDRFVDARDIRHELDESVAFTRNLYEAMTFANHESASRAAFSFQKRTNMPLEIRQVVITIGSAQAPLLPL
jgi:hypothetical protein